MTDERRNRIMWGIMLLVGALGSVSLRNNPALGITPFAVGVIQSAVFVCLMFAVRLSGWKMAALIAAVVPLCLWLQRFLDGFMIPVEMLVNLTMVGCMSLILGKKWHYLIRAAAVAFPVFFVMLAGSCVAIRIVKEESFVRALIVAWNMTAYSVFSILGAVAVSIPFNCKAK
ncbi:MAG: hypothetical protein IJE08_11820 [Clostridia bacterium]|nr:hypothetical protein [Clostridia bacterium]